jgi:nitrogen fixation protein NifQ
MRHGIAMKDVSYLDLMEHARDRADPATLAFAGVIGQALAAGRRPLIRELSEARFAQLMATCFPGLGLCNGEAAAFDRIDEFDDLLGLLLEYRAEPTERAAWLCCAIATASMGDNHLWQDLGLPDRKTLSELMRTYFPQLTARNVGDMKWKKFFYRQLCERAHIPICKSPSCAICTDYKVCFGPEEGEVKVASIAFAVPPSP